jgi:hypothetical protein
MSTGTTRIRPRMSFTALCEYLQATPTRRRTILGQQKYPSGPRVRSYNEARHRIARFAVDGVPLDPSGLDAHEREVVEILRASGWSPPSNRCSHPDPSQPQILVRGVRVSAYPDLILVGSPRDRDRTGAIKFQFPQRPDLTDPVGRWMASLLYSYRTTVLGDTATHPDLWLVHDVRQGRSFAASPSHTLLFRNVEEACREIAVLWPSV